MTGIVKIVQKDIEIGIINKKTYFHIRLCIGLIPQTFFEAIFSLFIAAH
jgi:hypothetical protein